LLDISLSQVNHVLNFLGRLLHLCFVSSPDCVCIARTSAIILPEDPYHSTLELTIDTGTKVYELSEKLAKRIPCFRRKNFALINCLIACSDWSNLYLCTNINDAVNIFYNILNEVFDTCVPTYYPKISNQPPWFNKELARLKIVKSRLHKKIRASNSQAAFCRYLSARSDVTVLYAPYSF